MDQREPWYEAKRVLPDGRLLFVVRQIFNYRLTIGHDEMTWEDAWDYDRYGSAIAAMLAWDGNTEAPGPWTRHFMSGRRRPGGDRSKEYIPEHGA